MPADDDVAVIGSGPNGLAAGIVAAQRRLRTVVHEANANGREAPTRLAAPATPPAYADTCWKPLNLITRTGP